MQAKPLAGCERIGGRVEIIPQYRMTQPGHVHAQLMAAPGQRGEPHARLSSRAFQYLPIRDGLAAIDRIDVLFGSIGPIRDQGLVDPA